MTIFSQIIAGTSPARFVWLDEHCVAFLTIEPRQPGHALVVPRIEVDRWVDLPVDLATHLMRVAHAIGNAQREAWDADRAGVMVEGYMVPHVHVHVWPSWSPWEFHPASIDHNAEPEELDAAAVRLRASLRGAGHPEVPDEPGTSHLGGTNAR